MQLWSYNHTTASSQRTPAGFDVRFTARTDATASSPRTPAGFTTKYDLRLEPTQQQAHKELLQDLTTSTIYGSNRHNSEPRLFKAPAGFPQRSRRSQRPHLATK
jgi:hypothetical protein